MTFFLGFMCGAMLGAIVTHLAYSYFCPINFEETGTWLGRTCPPCDGDCAQGRTCPAKEQA